jgi:hypothetical protein
MDNPLRPIWTMVDEIPKQLRPSSTNVCESGSPSDPADSGEGNRDSGLIVISVPEGCDQSSERSDAGRRSLQKVITIVKGKLWSSPQLWESGNREAISKGGLCPVFPQLFVR